MIKNHPHGWTLRIITEFIDFGQINLEAFKF
jgi:hypothetical protein